MEEVSTNQTTTINKKRKDRLFIRLFGSEEMKSNTLSLYNAMNGTDYTDPDAIEFNTIEDSLYMGMHNDVSFIVNSHELSLYEQQSTYNPNMPIRDLIYCGQLYNRFIKENKLNIYGTALQKIPAPKLVVFYNGATEKPDDMTLRLSDAFIGGAEGDIEVAVRMVNINIGHNKELLEKCRPLYDYSLFNNLVLRYNKDEDMNILDAVNKAINELPTGIVKDYLELHKSEVAEMMLSEYDEAEAMSLFYRDGVVDGLEKGRAEGEAKGRTKERELNKQISKLYYNEHMTPLDIAKKLNIDVSVVDDFVS